MSNHTPGPWRTISAGVFRNKTPAFDVMQDRNPEEADFIASKMTAGDAALIAAAPELLEACRAVIAEAEAVFVDTAEMSAEWRAVEAMCRAAITKATA